ncbi:MAG TPA: LysR family transcriptional regulator [Acidisphaera sp.]|nr:LysR family transcriptional regulator [Acidisphaera sp.]
MDLLAALTTFVRTSETLSFSAVAAERGVAQSAISRQVAALEKYYGVRLIHRTTRRLVLTEDGQHLLDHAIKVLEAAEAARDAMLARQGGIAGKVRLLVPTTLALRLSEQLGPFLQRHPGLELDVVPGDDPQEAKPGDFDLFVFEDDVPGHSMISRRIGEVASVLVAAPAYLQGAGSPSHPDELSAHACITYGRAVSKPVWSFVGPGHETREVEIRSRLHFGNPDLALHAALGGNGVARLPWPLVRTEATAGRLRLVMRAWRPPNVVLHVAYPSRRHLPGRTRAVLDFLTERLRIAEREQRLEPGPEPG